MRAQGSSRVSDKGNTEGGPVGNRVTGVKESDVVALSGLFLS